MYLGLLGLGVLVTAAGATLIGFGIPINAFSFGNTLIVAGTIALVGGLVLIGIATAVRQLRRIADGLGRPTAPHSLRPSDASAGVSPTPMPAPSHAAAAAPAPSTPAPPRGPLPPKPRPAAPRVSMPPRAAELVRKAGAARDMRSEQRPASVPGLEPLAKPSVEGALRDAWKNTRPSAPAMAPPRKPPEPRVAAPPIDASDELMPRDRRPASDVPGREGDAPVVAESGEVSLSSRAPARPALSLPASIAEVFGSKWAESRSEAAVTSEPQGPPHQDARSAASSEPGSGSSRSAEAGSSAQPLPEASEPASKLETPRPEGTAAPEKRGEGQPSEVLKSGVIDGMAYTLYTDGSITADLTQGTMRFASVEALRAHLDKGG